MAQIIISKNQYLLLLLVPLRLNTAISPEVLWLPKWTPDTNKSVSVLLNCENCVYFQVKVRMSYLYRSFTGYLAFHTWIQIEIFRLIFCTMVIKIQVDKIQYVWCVGSLLQGNENHGKWNLVSLQWKSRNIQSSIKFTTYI